MKNKKMKKMNKSTDIPYNFIWSKEKPLSFHTENYQKLIANLEYVNVDRKYKVFQITSSLGSEGKSTVLSNIAFLLGQKKQKVILIDLDLRRPKVHYVYDIENKDGLVDYLAGRIPIDKVIKFKKNYGFDVINSGEKTSAIINLLQSNKLKKLIDELKSSYDYILIDSPPVINVSDSLYISRLSDAVIFTLNQESTSISVAKEGVSLLKQNNINVIGIVINRVDLDKSSYGYGYGYSYGYNYDYENSDD